MPEVQFKDADGRIWSLAITIGVARDIKTEFGVDFIDDPQSVFGKDEKTPGLFLELADNLTKALDWIVFVTRSQRERAEISQENFEHALDAEALAAAHSALLESIAVFIQRLHPTMKAAILKIREIAAKVSIETAAAMDRLAEKIPLDKLNSKLKSEIDAAADRAIREIEELIDATAGNSSTGSPSAPASTPPTPTASENSSGEPRNETKLKPSE